MDLGLLDPGELVESPGAYEFGNRTFHCHKRSGHGRIDLRTTLSASADVYFYKLGETIGIDTLAQYGRRFGFGRRAGLAINGESDLMPTKRIMMMSHQVAINMVWLYRLLLARAMCARRRCKSRLPMPRLR